MRITGSKAEGLIFLKRHHFLTPDFYPVDYDTIQNTSLKDIIEQLNLPDNELWAVRSSADAEDGKHESYAGQFHTEINVKSKDLETALQKVIESYQKVAEASYGKSSFKYGVIIQKMLRPDYSGVIFSHNPVNPSENDVYINLIPGLGEPLVSGKETAFSVKISGKKINFTNSEDNFQGEIFTDKIITVKQSGKEIKSRLSPYIKTLTKEAKKISTLKNYPVDIEFCIADNKIYWLQVRPITSEPQAEKIIWDNSNIGENYPGLSLPLTVSFVAYTYEIAYTEMSRFLGFSDKNIRDNNALFANMSGVIYGALYYNVTAWQKLLYQLPFGKYTSKLITKTWNIENADFKKPPSSSLFAYSKLLINLFRAFIFFGKHKRRFEAEHHKIMRKYEKTDFTQYSHTQLIAKLNIIQNSLLKDWVTPMLNGFFTMILFSGLKRIIRKSRLSKKYPNFLNDILFSQGDVISVKIVHDFSDILDAVAENEAAKNLFKSEDIPEIKAKLETDFKEINKLIDGYIQNFGERCEDGELKMETVNYKENPLNFIRLLKQNIRSNVAPRKENTESNYQKILAKEYRKNPIKKLIFKKLIKLTLHRVRDRENYRFFRTQTFALVRRIMRAVDADLLNSQYITQKGDSLYLTFQEITDSSQLKNYKKNIAERKAEYADYANIKPAGRYIQTGDKFEAYIPPASGSDKLKGIACSSGTVKGKIYLIDSETIKQGNFEGKILAAKYFEPGWINLFSHAKAVLSEKGNLLSHTAILCREMGIPAIVGIKNLSRFVKTGDCIRMNGTTGDIELLKPESENSADKN